MEIEIYVTRPSGHQEGRKLPQAEARPRCHAGRDCTDGNASVYFIWTTEGEKIGIHWKPDTRSPFVPEKNSLICNMFLYAIHIVYKLHALVLGENSLISDLLYPVSSV